MTEFSLRGALFFCTILNVIFLNMDICFVVKETQFHSLGDAPISKYCPVISQPIGYW